MPCTAWTYSRSSSPALAAAVRMSFCDEVVFVMRHDMTHDFRNASALFQSVSLPHKGACRMCMCVVMSISRRDLQYS